MQRFLEITFIKLLFPNSRPSYFATFANKNVAISQAVFWKFSSGQFDQTKIGAVNFRPLNGSVSKERLLNPSVFLGIKHLSELH